MAIMYVPALQDYIGKPVEFSIGIGGGVITSDELLFDGQTTRGLIVAGGVLDFNGAVSWPGRVYKRDGKTKRVFAVIDGARPTQYEQIASSHVAQASPRVRPH